MIIFEAGFIMLATAAIAGPIIYLGFRRYVRVMNRLVEQEDERDRKAHIL